MNKHLLFLLAGILLVSCSNPANNPIRQKIEFNQPVSTVADSIRAIYVSIDSLPFKLKTNEYYYVIRNDDVNIDQKYICKTNDLFNLDYKKISVFNNSNQANYKHFVNLMLFLKSNYINAVYLDHVTGVKMCDYRQLFRPSIVGSWTDERQLAFMEDISDTIALQKEYNILDRKDKLILLAPKPLPPVKR
jgi:hypothetical protein